MHCRSFLHCEDSHPGRIIYFPPSNGQQKWNGPKKRKPRFNVDRCPLWSFALKKCNRFKIIESWNAAVPFNMPVWVWSCHSFSCCGIISWWVHFFRPTNCAENVLLQWYLSPFGHLTVQRHILWFIFWLAVFFWGNEKWLWSFIYSTWGAYKLLGFYHVCL